MAKAKLDRTPAEEYLERMIAEGKAKKQLLSMRQITVDMERFQPRVKLSREHVRDLCRIVEMAGPDVEHPIHPVVCFDDGTMSLLIMADGFHRHDMALHLKWENIPAWVVTVENPEEEAILFGASANLKMGLYPSAEDKKKAAMRILALPRAMQMPDADIARHCGIGPTTARRYRQEYCQQNGIPLPEKVLVTDDRGGSRLVPYSRPSGNHRPAIFPVRNAAGGVGGFNASIRGKPKYLGPTRERAEKRLDEILGEMRDAGGRVVIGHRGTLHHWLTQRGVVLTGLKERGSPVGGLLCGGSVVVVCPNSDRGSVLVSIGEAVLARKYAPECRDTVIMCYHCDFDRSLSWVKGSAELPPSPIRFMTPEEFVEEFRPKEGEASA